jgi:hypothetical protein
MADTPIPADIMEAAREWTRWKDQRAPNARGIYRYRVRAEILGAVVTVEWSEEMTLCGMGHAESEWWPLRSCRWNGYQRYITHEGLEWSTILPSDPDGIVWHGLDLLPCPFTGQPAHIEAVGRYIGAPLWHSEAVYIWSAGVPKRRWTSIPEMVKAWNARVILAERTAQAERIRELEMGFIPWPMQTKQQRRYLANQARARSALGGNADV